MACRRLQLIRSELVNVNYQFLGAARLRIDVSDPENTGADPNIFLYLRGQPDPVTQLAADVWRGMASPVDMVDYPANEPVTTTPYPFFRLSYIEVDLRTIGLLNQVWDHVVLETGVLLEALDRLEALVPTTTVMLGTPCPVGPTSDSSGSSASL